MEAYEDHDEEQLKSYPDYEGKKLVTRLVFMPLYNIINACLWPPWTI